MTLASKLLPVVAAVTLLCVACAKSPSDRVSDDLGKAKASAAEAMKR